MSERDLTNKEISQEYGKLVQIHEGKFYDGLGNEIPFESTTDIDFIELDLKLSGSVSRFKEFIYDVSGNITQIKIYKNSTKTELLYVTDYTYEDDNISTISTTRISDMFNYTKTFTYNIAGNITSIDTVVA